MSMPLLRIEGHGPVALALRLFLARQGFAAGQVAIDEPIAELPDWLAARSLAMSLGNCCRASPRCRRPRSSKPSKYR